MLTTIELAAVSSTGFACGPRSASSAGVRARESRLATAALALPRRVQALGHVVVEGVQMAARTPRAQIEGEGRLARQHHAIGLGPRLARPRPVGALLVRGAVGHGVALELDAHQPRAAAREER